MATDPKPEALPIRADSFATTPHARVAIAGLLAAHPELVDADLPAATWQKKLDGYLTSERT